MVRQNVSTCFSINHHKIVKSLSCSVIHNQLIMPRNVAGGVGKRRREEESSSLENSENDESRLAETITDEQDAFVQNGYPWVAYQDDLEDDVVEEDFPEVANILEGLDGEGCEYEAIFDGDLSDFVRVDTEDSGLLCFNRCDIDMFYVTSSSLLKVVHRLCPDCATFSFKTLIETFDTDKTSRLYVKTINGNRMNQEKFSPLSKLGTHRPKVFRIRSFPNLCLGSCSINSSSKFTIAYIDFLLFSCIDVSGMYMVSNFI
jgi:hypothetical protein